VGIISRITDWVTMPYTIYLILKDPAISQAVKLRAVIPLLILFAYIISPIDIIPDYIPLAGWLDDLVVIPLGLALVRKITPCIDLMEKRIRAQARVKRILLWTALAFLAAILLGLIWLGLVIYLLVRLISG
jgi:uncharacterized membrane protein YkvA (DUF1232 family)